MNLFIILYITLLSAASEVQKPSDPPTSLIINKVVKPIDRPIEESSVYHHAPTEWVKISKKI